MSVLSKAYMHDEAAAFAHVESIIWPEGPVCPHCGVVDRAYRLEGVYQHCNKKHMYRYAAEFEFRYNNRSANGVEDADRGQIALRGFSGKRLTYIQ